MKLEAAGAKTFALGLLLLGAVSAAGGQYIPGLQPAPAPPEAPDVIARLNGILLVALSSALFIGRFQKPAAALLAVYLAGWFLAVLVPQILFEPFEITRMVSLMEVAAIIATLAILVVGPSGRSSAAARTACIVYGCMLLLFAGVHFQYHDFIASMIPWWVPFAALWPWFTASANLAAGLSFLNGFKPHIGGALLGAMYASWVPIVHLPRVLASPGNVEEWTAGALAVTLAGAAWMVAGSGQGRGFDPVASLASTVRRFIQQMSEREAAG
jgi:uncharacterized membrane protein YphA (DoxX/SURF4 family)